MQIENLINEIATNLSIIIYQVKLKNKANLNDINTLLETPFKDILNIIYDYNLINLNNKYLYPAIDLGDRSKKIAFQITSERSIQKIKDTLQRFEKNKLNIEYEKLKFLVIDEKIQYSKKHNIDKEYFVLKDDVISCFELINIIKDLEVEKQKQINERLRCVIGLQDKISLDTIFDNRSNVKKIEQEYTQKLALTKEILTTTNLPIELQKYFEVKAEIIDDKLKYTLKPSVEDAFEIHPIQDKFKMKFNSSKEKEDFIKNGGINGLIKEATIARKPIAIPYVTEIKEYIGNYENPFSDINQRKNEDIKLYIMPKDLPKGKNYIIEMDDTIEKFKIKVKLQMVYATENYIILNNYESKNEKFDIYFKINIIEKDEINKLVSCSFNIKCDLREKYKYDCESNLELQKFLFIINGSKSRLRIKECSSKKEVLSIHNIGKEIYDDNKYLYFKKYKNLMKKILYIQKNFNIDIKYNLDNFYRNEQKIDIVYYDSKEQKYKFKYKDDIIATFKVKEFSDTYKNIITDYPNPIKLFDNDFYLKSTKILFLNCKLNKKEEIDGNKLITITSNNVQYVPKSKLQK